MLNARSCFHFTGRGLTIAGAIIEGDFNERADDVALGKEVRNKSLFSVFFFFSAGDF